MKKQTIPELYRFVIPIIEVLKEMGGEGKANEVIELVINKCNISEKELEKKLALVIVESKTKLDGQEQL